jgi:hypothetical protein
MTVIPKRPRTALLCECVEKSGTFQFRISGVHHSLAKQDKFHAMIYEILLQSGTCSLPRNFTIQLL